MGLILDSTACVSAERLGLSAFEIFLTLPADLRQGPLAISVITLSELAFGLRRAESQKRFARRRLFLSEIERAFDPVPVSGSIALRAGVLRADLEMRGQATGLADLFIAATALELGYGVATSNVRHFRRVPGLQVVEL